MFHPATHAQLYTSACTAAYRALPVHACALPLLLMLPIGCLA